MSHWLTRRRRNWLPIRYSKCHIRLKKYKGSSYYATANSKTTFKTSNIIITITSCSKRINWFNRVITISISATNKSSNLRPKGFKNRFKANPQNRWENYRKTRRASKKLDSDGRVAFRLYSRLKIIGMRKLKVSPINPCHNWAFPKKCRKQSKAIRTPDCIQMR